MRKLQAVSATTTNASSQVSRMIAARDIEIAGLIPLRVCLLTFPDHELHYLACLRRPRCRFAPKVEVCEPGGQIRGGLFDLLIHLPGSLIIPELVMNPCESQDNLGLIGL